MYETSKIPRKENPRETASIFSLFSFFYTLDIYHKSKHKDLEEDDIYNVIPNCRSETLGDTLEKKWQKEVKSGRKSLTKVLLSMFGGEYFYYGCLNLLIKTPINAIIPYATGILVSYFEANSTTTQEKAIVCGLTIIVAGIIKATYSNFYLFIVYRLSVQIEIALSSYIYRKSLRITQNSLSKITNGRIVTIMVQDSIVAFGACILFLQDIWTGMVELLIILLIVYLKIGPSAVIGIAVFLALMPIQFWMGRKVKELSLRSLSLMDERIRRIQEVLTSIKLIKMYGWEKYFTKVVRKIRKIEMRIMRNKYFVIISIQTLSIFNFKISYFLCIFSYYMMGNAISAESLFFVVTCYQSIEVLLTYSIPAQIAQLGLGKSAIERINDFFLMEEVEQQNDQSSSILSKEEITKLGEHKSSKGRLHFITDLGVRLKSTRVSPEIILDNGAVLKGTSVSPEIILENVTVKNVYNNVNLHLIKPSLIGITGGTGSGKSTLLKILLNEVLPDSGKVCVEGEISYASQEPWLFPSTIRQNILFGNPYDPNRYYQVLKSCALIQDLEKLPDGDLTVVNDKGVNLSGGQKARINLARAIYRKADIYLLDDILPSLDLNVSKHVFDSCYRKFLRNTLCIFVCQTEQYLNAADENISIKDGCVEVTSNAKAESDDVYESDNNDAVECSKWLDENIPYVKLYKEHKVPGKVLWKDYKKCFELAGGWMIITIVLSICLAAQSLGMVFNSYADNWLEVEAKVLNATYFSNDTSTSNDVTDLELERKNVLTAYGIVLFISIIFIILQNFSFFAMTVRAARNMHWLAFEKIMGATMHFFDETFAGSIVNRLSKDMAHVDEYVAANFYYSVRNTFELAVTIWFICYINPMLCVPTFVLFLVVLYVADRFLRSSRSLRRLEPIARAPCIGYLSTSLKGVETIRATGNQKVLIAQFDRHQNLYSSVEYMMFMTKYGFMLWVDLIGQLFQFCIIFSFILFYDKLDNIAGNVGVAVTQAIGVSASLQSCLINWSETESSMTASERVLEYTEAPQEDTSGETPQNWPESNKIEYKSVSLKYPNHEANILNNINFNIEDKQKIGIIGRTGAGKSSLITLLFRLYEPEGIIAISGSDSKELNLKMLRSKISIIPQDPVLFKGTIRSNLDPENLYSDQALWNALEKVGLKPMIKQFGLVHEVEEGGLNFSIGQRQLFSFARVVLSNNKIVVFDEATANLDDETESATTELIKELFVDCTLLIIAHRMSTVIGCDKIMVVDGGEIMEFDEPKVLMKNNSYFNSLFE